MSQKELDENALDGCYTTDLQANILRGVHFPHARFLFVAFERGEGLAWLDWFRSCVADGGIWQKTPGVVITVAFTHRGLKELGVRSEILRQFSKAFRDGMRARSAALGDDPDQKPWDGVFTQDSIHALVSLYGSDPDHPEILDDRVEEICNHHGVRKLDVQNAELLQDEYGNDFEHFGFRDGISQPIQEDPSDQKRWKSDVPIKEFLIFSSNWNDGNSKEGDPGLRLGRLGTYLVYRKLEQHVAEFRRFTMGWGIDPERVAAKMIGRWRDGTPLAKHKTGDPNGFDFSDDPDGRLCPIGAHISRVNPRARLAGGAGEHRILRRGVPYGPPAHPARKDGGVDQRGLVFIGLNASIEKQFEFVQRKWINEPKFNGLDGVDPIVSTGKQASGKFRFHRGGPSRRLQKFVQLRGGEYFFVPSIKALEELAKGEFSGS